MYTIEEIMDFLEKYNLKYTRLTESTDIHDDCGIWGDDFHELIDKFAETFHVNMGNYLWYFHGEDEGLNFGALFFKPIYRRVKRIPLTPKLLLQFANEGKWGIKYPEHRLPKYRVDIIINKFAFGCILILLIIALIKKFI